MSRIDQHQFDVVSATETEVDGIFDSVPQSSDVVHSFWCGWCWSKSRGENYGKKYLGLFNEDAEQLFVEGCEEKFKSMWSGRMLNVFQSRNPNHLDLPSETEIHEAISTPTAKNENASLSHCREGEGDSSRHFPPRIIDQAKSCFDRIRKDPFERSGVWIIDW